MEYRTFSYRDAERVFDSHDLQQIKWEVFDIIKRAPAIKLAKPKTRKREGSAPRTFHYDQKAMNAWFDKEFTARDWEFHPNITGDDVTKLQADFKKARVQVEVQFGNIARAIYDLFKMAVSYSLERIDVGVLVVPMHDFADDIDENVAHFERVTRELPYAKATVTLPILVIGIAPKIPTGSQGSKQGTLPG